MKKGAEEITERLLYFFNDMIYKMLMAVENEQYEIASKLRDAIEMKIEGTINTLIRKGLTTLTYGELKDQIDIIKSGYILSWVEIIDIPKERVPINI
jgi:hypothetical protein